MPTNAIAGKIKGGLQPAYDVGPQAGQPVPNMLTSGNVDVNHRPSILNADGSHSSIFSMTVPIGQDGAPIAWPKKGKTDPRITGYALVPSIADGKFLTSDGKMPDKAHIGDLEDAATSYYGKTRQHLGVFSSPDAADAYATSNHDYGNDGTANKVFTPSPRVAGATGLNGYPPVVPNNPPIPQALQGSPSDSIYQMLKSALGVRK